MQLFNMYLCGVGGQGIGLLSEILLRASDYAGYTAKAVDTHGLAQRGGTVISQIRLGEVVFTPLIPERTADLVVALERHEALRGVQVALRDQGTLIYYNTVLQPLGVRLGTEPEISAVDIDRVCAERGITVFGVSQPDLPDPRMQNIVVLAHIHRHGLIPGLQTQHFLQAMEDLLTDTMLTENLRLFQGFDDL
jgi:indolepyruvate ferredoxin oxidoreductase beta subunit